MIIKERYGIRADGNPVVETSTYTEVPPDHPLAQELEGVEGFWVRVSVGNSLAVLGATPVSRQTFVDASEERELLVQAKREELDQQREFRKREMESKKGAAMAELRKLGIPLESIQSLLDKAR